MFFILKFSRCKFIKMIKLLKIVSPNETNHPRKPQRNTTGLTNSQNPRFPNAINSSRAANHRQQNNRRHQFYSTTFVVLFYSIYHTIIVQSFVIRFTLSDLGKQTQTEHTISVSQNHILIFFTHGTLYIVPCLELAVFPFSSSIFKNTSSIRLVSPYFCHTNFARLNSGDVLRVRWAYLQYQLFKSPIIIDRDSCSTSNHHHHQSR